MSYDAILDSVTAYNKYKYIAWGIVSLIILIAIILSIYCNNWSILARSGALIVIVALFLEGAGITQYYSDKIIKFLKELIYENMILEEKRSPSNLKKEAFLNAIEKNQLLAEKLIYSKFKKTEFSIATIGTLLWGFADLIGCYI